MDEKGKKLLRSVVLYYVIGAALAYLMIKGLYALAPYVDTKGKFIASLVAIPLGGWALTLSGMWLFWKLVGFFSKKE